MSKRASNTLNSGPISWMARNPVAANLLMLVALAGGILGAFRVKQEVFPEFNLDIITITVPYPGASPADVEQGILLVIEEAVRGLDGVKRVSSVASEGFGTVSVELLLGADPNKVLSDVKGAVDRIQSFPEDAEKPNVAIVTSRRAVISLIIAGDQDLRTLHTIAEKTRQDLLDLPDITQVELAGVRPMEVSIEIPRETLESYGLTLEEVARQVKAASIELPGGKIETRSGELMVRVADRRKAGHEFSNIIIRGTKQGFAVRLGDIATIRDGYADTNQASYFNGKPAVRVTAYRVGDETPIKVAKAVRDYAERLRSELPDNITVAVWADDSEKLKSRIDLLTNNAIIGFVLVVVVLSLFLKARLAGWVALGIPVSFFGTLALMPALGLSINMITLFALIVTLGMVVDDAIVIGENVHAKLEAGVPRLQAAIEGAKEMAAPVAFSILTTIAAFTPLFFVPGVMGKIFSLMPAVVISVLGISLFESFFVLPAHLGHGRQPKTEKGLLSIVEKVQKRASRWLDSMTTGVYKPVFGWTLRQRYISLAIAITVLLLCGGLVKAGIVPFNFFPKLEGDVIIASARLPYGAPIERTMEVRQKLESAAQKALAECGGRRILRGMFTRLAESGGQNHFRGNTTETGSHLVTVEVNLVPTDQRDFSAAEFAAAWAKHTPDLPGLEALTFNHSIGPGAGAAVDVQLSHTDTTILAEASNEMSKILRGFNKLINVENSYAAGKPQLDFHLLPAARTLGLTSSEIARQLRAAFFGAEALREQRGRNEVKVMVRLPKKQRRSEYDIEEFLVRTPAGGYVPLSYVARFDRGSAPTAIQREEGKRIVNVSAELAPGVASPQEVLATLREKEIPALKNRFPGLNVDMVGQQREQRETFANLRQNFLFALFLIFALLAIPFRSYSQPLIIMSAIPFGFVGAIAGHLLMGYSLSVISMLGIVALSGVVVNDSLVLIDATNKERAQGKTPMEAVMAGGVRRLRPIMLTSLTTFFGLMPMILETSIQARFLIPMAISLGFGILFSTFTVLLLVPALYLVLEDIRQLFRRNRPNPLYAEMEQMPKEASS